MSAAAVVIGVNKTGGLPELGGAVPGAREFYDWAYAQGMAVTLLTDEAGPLKLDNVFEAVQRITSARTYEKLVVFFAGHGFLLGPQTEIWLLSGAQENGNEAVNLQLSLANARYCGIPHIIFVSDACRSAGPTLRHRSITGGTIFPTPATYDQDGKLDSFFACRPGDPALEFADEKEAAANYKGVFTEVLLEALEGKAPAVAEKLVEDGATRWVVTSRGLDMHLRQAVPIRAADISIKLSQTPEIRPESALPSYFGLLEKEPVPVPAPTPTRTRGPTRGPRRGPTPTPTPPPAVVEGLGDFVERTWRPAMSFDTLVPSLATEATTEEERLFAEQAATIASSRGRGHYETHTGFTVYGGVKAVTTGDGIGAEFFEDADVTHIRVHDPQDYQGRTLLIEFDNGLGTIVAIKPGYIGTILLDGEQVVSVNYTPSDNTNLYSDEYAGEDERIERRRAFAAAASRHGVFSVDPSEAAGTAEYLRMMKSVDPTLGVYAAYAFHQAGQLDKIRDVLQWMVSNDPPPVPYDVCLLARDLTSPAIAPCGPMLSQGWALLELAGPPSPVLRELQTMLVPSLWTAFSADGVARARQALQAGELR